MTKGLSVRDASSYTHRSVRLPNSEHNYHYIDQVPEGQAPKATCVLLHGFPDSWYGWRYQIKALAEAGYRVIAPSTLGYGPTSQPDDLKAYSYQSLATDLCKLLDQAGVQEKILLFGHDWGGLLAWRFANFYPDRVQAIGVASTPYMPPAQKRDKYASPEDVVKRLPNFGYQLFFKSDEGRELVSNNLDSVLVPMFSQTTKPPQIPAEEGGEKKPWTYPGEYLKRLTRVDAARRRGYKMPTPSAEQDPELSYYLDSFHRYGIKHALNYYRTQKICFDEEQASGVPAKFPKDIPAYFLTGDSDEALTLDMSEGSPRFFEKGQYKRDILGGADHWLLQNAKYRDEVSRRFVAWANANSQSSRGKAKL